MKRWMLVNKERIKIIADSGSDVPQEIIKKWDVSVMPLKVIYKDAEYLDGVTITPNEVYESLEKEIPSTSLPSGEDMKRLIDQAIEEGYEKIIMLTISSGLSGTNNMANLVAKDYPELDIEVIDTLSIGIGSGIFAVRIVDMIREGYSFKEIVADARSRVQDSKVFFSIPTLEYLQAGGRIGRVTSLVGGFLKINPIISCDDEGIYYPVSMTRGRKKSLEKIIENLKESAQGSQSYNIGIAYGGADAEKAGLNIYERVKESFPNINEIYFGSVSPALGVHTGPGLIGGTVQPLD